MRRADGSGCRGLRRRAAPPRGRRGPLLLGLGLLMGLLSLAWLEVGSQPVAGAPAVVRHTT